MKRNVMLSEISDGKLYSANDMVKADCGGCKDCFACCRGMGESIVLDPLDIYYLQTNLQMSFGELMTERIELNVVDGIVLPNLKMSSGGDDRCSFLDGDGRCSIHAFRPGICRLFPLGRYYEDGSFQYFLQVHECKNQNRSKVKVKKWLGIPELRKYEEYISSWHYFLLDLQEKIEASDDEDYRKQMSMLVLQNFYLQEYGTDFYEEFFARLATVKAM